MKSLLLPSIFSIISRTSADAPNIIRFSVVFLRPAPSLFPPFFLCSVSILINLVLKGSAFTHNQKFSSIDYTTKVALFYNSKICVVLKCSNLSVWKTLPSKARVTRDRVSWITICTKTLSGRQYHKYCHTGRASLACILWTLRAQLRSFSLGIASQA